MTTLPRTMRAIEVTEPGEPEVLVIGERAVPSVGAGDVLIRVAAAGVNRADVMQRRGNYPPPPGASDVLGLEVSGTVAAVGEAVSGWRVDDAVCALLAGGGYAEYCAVPAPLCLPVPGGLDVVDAAALPEVVLTVWTNVFERGRLVAGETLLVHGGSSGIGTMAIQLARAFGSRVFVTAGSAEKLAGAADLGMNVGINYHDQDFAAVIDEVTSGVGVGPVAGPSVGDGIGATSGVARHGDRAVVCACRGWRKGEVHPHADVVLTTRFRG